MELAEGHKASKKAIYWPAGGKLLARITYEGKLVCIFKAPPTDEQGHAMAKALTPVALPDEKDTKFWDGDYDPFGAGFNTCLALWKESLNE